MERAYESKHIFELKLHFYKDLVNLHYERLNIFEFILLLWLPLLFLLKVRRMCGRL